MQQPRIHTNWYVFSDAIVCCITWFIFYYLRTIIYSYPFSVPPGFYLGLFLYVLGWLLLHFITGSYGSLYSKSRVAEFFRTFIVCTIGCIFLLFFFILKNPQVNNHYYYEEFFSLQIPIFVLTVTTRLTFLKIVKKQIETKKIFFPTLIIGSSLENKALQKAFLNTKNHAGYVISSIINIEDTYEKKSSAFKTEEIDTIETIIAEKKIEEVIITIDKRERDRITQILQHLSNKEVNIKISPDNLDIISGALHTNDVMGVPLIDIHSGILPSWQQNIKRTIDLIISLICLIVLLPITLYTAIRVALSSKGPIFYSQERIGFKGKPFMMYKFRSMIVDAEVNGPQLSSDYDQRITKWGKTMRKWRIDELPQLWNVIKGEMSIIGPRPERKFYIDQISMLHPEYKYLFKVKPGITSWGMVNFGYASSVQEMIERMSFDLLYVENVSLLLDFKIMLYTLKIIFSGTGK